MYTLKELIRSIEMEKACGPSRDEACFGQSFPPQRSGCRDSSPPTLPPCIENVASEPKDNFIPYTDPVTGETFYKDREIILEKREDPITGNFYHVRKDSK